MKVLGSLSGAAQLSLFVSGILCASLPPPTDEPRVPIIHHIARRQVASPYPADPNTVAPCNGWIQAFEGDDCKALADYAKVDLDLFVFWNPSLKDNCAAVVVGNGYCTDSPVRPGGGGGSTPPTTTPTPTPTDIGVPPPGPTQDGAIAACARWDYIDKLYTCDTFIKKYASDKLSVDLLFSWNPAIGSDCNSMWYKYYLCTLKVGYKPGDGGADPSPTPTTTGNGIPTPTPIQDGQAKNCDKWEFIKPRDTCTTVLQRYPNLTLADLIKWNPAVGNDCTSIWANTYLCVHTLDFVPHPPTTTTPPPTTTTPGSGIQTPTPIQDGQVGNCDKWEFIKLHDTCTTVLQKYPALTLADLVKWNPAIGNDCTSIWANTYLCVHTTDFKPKPPPTTTTPGSGIATPSPVQPGMVNNCNKFYFVKEKQTCQQVCDENHISMSQLLFWNRGIDAKCTTMWSKVYVCVGVVRPT